MLRLSSPQFAFATRLVLTIVVACFLSEALASQIQAEEPGIAASAPEASIPQDSISQWIRDLNSDSFETREAATVQLERTGAAAIELLVQAAGGESLEVTTRAVRILQAIFRSGNDKASEAAEAALEHLTARPNRAAARRASIGLVSQDVVRQKRAIAKIEEMGGVVEVIETIRGPNGEPSVKTVKLLKGWKGGDAGLAQLKRLGPSFFPVYVVDGANVTPAGLEDLQKTAPNLRIEHRGQAMLGVSAIATEKGCQIGLIAENSAAEQAGLEEGDLITRFNGEPVKQFETVIEITRKLKAGDKIQVEIIREGETLQKEVILGEWK